MQVYNASSFWDWKTAQCLQNNNSPEQKNAHKTKVQIISVAEFIFFHIYKSLHSHK